MLTKSQQQILRLIGELQPTTSRELAARKGCSISAVLLHLRVLKGRELLVVEKVCMGKRGWTWRYSLSSRGAEVLATLGSASLEPVLSDLFWADIDRAIERARIK